MPEELSEVVPETQAIALDNLPTVPASYIVEWGKDVIPEGWALCNGSHNERLPEKWILYSGSNNLPDMRDRFVIAVDSQGSRRLALVFIMKLEEE